MNIICILVIVVIIALIVVIAVVVVIAVIVVRNNITRAGVGICIVV